MSFFQQSKIVWVKIQCPLKLTQQSKRQQKYKSNIAKCKYTMFQSTFYSQSSHSRNSITITYGQDATF